MRNVIFLNILLYEPVKNAGFLIQNYTKVNNQIAIGIDLTRIWEWEAEVTGHHPGFVFVLIPMCTKFRVSYIKWYKI